MSAFELVADPAFDAMPKPDGWVYRDMKNPVSYDIWNTMIEVIGAGNYRILAATRRQSTVRAQFLISPQGLERLAAHRKPN